MALQRLPATYPRKKPGRRRAFGCAENASGATAGAGGHAQQTQAQEGVGRGLGHGGLEGGRGREGAVGDGRQLALQRGGNAQGITQQRRPGGAERQVGQLVVGLPRNLNGQETAQTKAVQSFVEGLQAVVRLPIAWQDEAVTSRQAEAELNRRGKPYERGDIDALAACYILDDYLRTLGNGKL